jgi:hypothetical protein
MTNPQPVTRERADLLASLVKTCPCDALLPCEPCQYRRGQARRIRALLRDVGIGR